MASNAHLTAFYRSGPSSPLRTGSGEIVELRDGRALEEARADCEGLLWVDIQISAEADVSVLKDVFQFHPLTIEDCLSPHVDTAKVDDHEGYIFVVVQALTGYEPGMELEA